MSSWYDHPQYFDMVFRDETAAEVAFFGRAFERFASGPVRRLLEPGCGSGRLVAAMAGRGYDVVGLDQSRPMLAYLRRRLRRRGLRAGAVHGDMTRMSLGRSFDAAFCTFNTFRHLTDEASAESHLNSVADHLRPGGIYLLGFHLIPLDADTECTERWTAGHAGTRVHVTLRVVAFDRRRRLETLRVIVKAVRPSGQVIRIRSEFPLRLYTVGQARRLLAKVSRRMELVEVFDFDYDIDGPRSLDGELTDALFVLRRR